jgi:hypothetical protein
LTPDTQGILPAELDHDGDVDPDNFGFSWRSCVRQLAIADRRSSQGIRSSGCGKGMTLAIAFLRMSL